MSTDRIHQLVKAKLAEKAKAEGTTQDYTFDDGDSGYVGNPEEKQKFRVKGGNTLESGNNFNRVDAHPDGELAKETVQELKARGARIRQSKEKGRYKRTLSTFEDEKGRDLMKEMVLSGLAMPDRSKESAALERARTAREFLGYDTTGNDYIRGQATKRVGGKDFSPWEKGKAPDNIYDRRSVLHRAWDRGVDGTKADLGGAINYLGDALGNDELTQIGKEMSQRASNDVKLNPAKIANYTEVDNMSDAFTYLVETLGEQAPSLIVDIIGTAATGGAGATVAIARRAGIEAVKKGVKKGLYAGPVLTGFTQSLGNMENALEEEGSEINTGAALAAGAVGGAVNLAPYALVAGDILKASGLGKKAVKEVVENTDKVEKLGALDRLQDVAKTGGKAGLAEGITEPSQEILNEVIKSGALDQDFEFDSVQIADSAIRALMAGGVTGGTASATANLAGAYQQYADEQEKHRQENLDEEGYDKSYVPPKSIIAKSSEETSEGTEQAEGDVSKGKAAVKRTILSALKGEGNGSATEAEGTKHESRHFGTEQTHEQTQQNEDMTSAADESEDESFEYSADRRAGKLEENGIYGADSISPRKVPNIQNNARFDEIDALLNPNGAPLSLKEVRALIDQGAITEDEVNSYIADDIMNSESPVYLLPEHEASFRNNVAAAKKVLEDDVLSIRERKSLEDALHEATTERPEDTAEDKERRRSALHFRLRDIAPAVQEKAKAQKHYDWRKNYQAFRENNKAKTVQTVNKDAPNVEEKPDGAQQLAAKREEAIGVAEWAKAEYEAKRISAAEYKLLMNHSRKILSDLRQQELDATDESSATEVDASFDDTADNDGGEVDEETQELDAQYSEKGEKTLPDGFSVVETVLPSGPQEITGNYARRTGANKGLVDYLKGAMGAKYEAALDRMLSWANTPTGDEKRAGAKEGQVGPSAYAYTEHGKESTAQKATAKGATHIPEKTVYHRTLVQVKKKLREGDYAGAFQILEDAGLTADSMEANAPQTLEQRFEQEIEHSKSRGTPSGITVKNTQTGDTKTVPFPELVKLSLDEAVKQGARDPSEAESYSKLIDLLQSAAQSALSTIMNIQDKDGNYLYEIDVRDIPNDTVVFTALNNRKATVTMGALRNKTAASTAWKAYFKKLGREHDLDVQRVLEDESRVKVFLEESGMDIDDDALYALATKLRLKRKGKENKLTAKENEIYDAIVEIEVKNETSRNERPHYSENHDMDSGAGRPSALEIEADNTTIEESVDGLEYATDEGIRPTKGKISERTKTPAPRKEEPEPVNQASDRTTDNTQDSGILYSQDIPKDELDRVSEAMQDDEGAMPKGRKIQTNRKLVRGMRRMPKAGRLRLLRFIQSTNTRLKEIHRVVADATYKFNRNHRIASERLLSIMGKTFTNAKAINQAYEDALNGRPTEGAKKYLALLGEIESAVKEGDKTYKRNWKKVPIHLKFVKVLDNRKAFTAILRESGVKDVDDIVERIFTGEGHADFDIEKREVGRPARSMAELKPAYEKLKAAGFIDSDAPRHLARYIHAATKYGEWAKMFGGFEMVDGKKVFNPNFKMDVYRSEVHPDNAEEFNKLIKGITGALGTDMGPTLRAFNSGAMAFQAATVYLFTAVSSIPEIAAVYARSRGLLKGVDKDLGVIFSRTSRQDMLRIAQEFDIVTPNTIEHSVQQMYNMDDLTVGRFSQAVTSTVFKYNGQMWLTRMTRALGVQVGQRFLEAHANTDSDNSRRMLAELGITAEEVKAFLKTKDLKSAVGKKYRNALHLFVDESVTNPNSSQVPLIMNDPRFAIFTTLKKFFYAFYDNVHKGLYRDAKNRGGEGMSVIYPALLTATMLVPLGMLAELLKEQIKYPMGRPDGKNKSFGEWSYNGLMASGAFGPVHLAEAVYERSGYGANPFVAALGPTADVVYQTLTGDIKATRFMPVVNQLPPLKKEVNASMKKLVD